MSQVEIEHVQEGAHLNEILVLIQLFVKSYLLYVDNHRQKLFRVFRSSRVVGIILFMPFKFQVIILHYLQESNFQVSLNNSFINCFFD